MLQHQNALASLLTDGGQLLTREDFESENEFQSWGIDRSLLKKPDFSILIFPHTTNEVSRVIKYCYKNKLNIVPSGGRTGLCGGAIASRDEIVLNLAKMDQLIRLNKKENYIQAQAGMITSVAEDHCNSIDCSFPLDLASSGSSFIGGNVATHAGGIRVIRYGLLRNHVLGMTVVTGTGEILNLFEEVKKNNTGYNMMPLFIGSEGTLAVITELRIALVPKPQSTGVALLSIKGISNALESLQGIYDSEVKPLAFEYFDRLSYEIVKKHLNLPEIFNKTDSHFLLFEWEKGNLDNSENKILEWMNDEINKGNILDGHIAQSSHQQKTFWSYREGISESLSHGFVLDKNDISVPLAKISEFISQLNEILQQQNKNLQCCIFGHLADGNLHINLLKPKPMSTDDFKKIIMFMNQFIFESIQKLDGSISAEHGIGLLKKDYLKYSRSSLEIEYMKKIKSIFDPVGILNPGKIF